jgi:hypothetical protein
MQIVQSSRGSQFVLCRRSRENPAFPRYPPLPMRRCPGYEPPRAGAADESGNE